LRIICDEKEGRYLVGEPFTPELPMKFIKISRAAVAAQYCQEISCMPPFALIC